MGFILSTSYCACATQSDNWSYEHWALIYLEEALASSFEAKNMAAICQNWSQMVPVRAISDTLKQIGPSTVREFSYMIK